MAATEFTWNDYLVPADRAGRAFARLAATDEPARETVRVALPDLTAFASPRDKAEILLHSAAEVEHALMAQYLYAAYSLKASREVTDPAQKQVLNDGFATSWPQVLLAIAREEMGHLMSVQNLLLLLGLAPNLEREDFPPRKDLYPFALHLEPLSRRSLAKYVVAEAPSDAPGIEDIVELATESAGAQINRVGVLYGLLGLVFASVGQVEAGASGDEGWDAMVRQLAAAAYQQSPPPTWHLREGDFQPQSLARQADPADWQVSGLRVHRVGDRAAAVQAIRDIGEQGEGPTGEGEVSHFGRLLGIFRGGDEVPPFPATGAWLPTREVPTDPKVQDIANPRTRRWAELADARYALVLGFIEHYLLAPDEHRDLLVAWIFAEMRSRLAFIARQLTTMPRAEVAGQAGVAAIPFSLPAELHLPADEAARWDVHRRRTQAAIAKLEEMRGGDAADAGNQYLADLLASDSARLELIAELPTGASTSSSFARDILPLFRQKDVQHMRFRGVELETYDGVRDRAAGILDRLRVADASQMPPPPDQPWTQPQLKLFERWIAEGFPR